jgi:hypothetical protein
MRYHSVVTSKDIRDRVTTLKLEIADIREANERYFARTANSPEQQAVHKGRLDWLKRIREELRFLSTVKASNDPSPAYPKWR